MKQRLLHIIFFGLISITGFSQSVDKKLIGDWISADTRYILSFTDSTIGFFDWGDFENCFTKNDTIYFNSRDKIQRDYSESNDKKWEPKIVRTIVDGIDTLGKYEIIKDSLTIYTNHPDLSWDYKIQNYHKISCKDSILFDSLMVETSMCYGLCPSMELKLLSNGDFFFKGKAYTEKLGSYKGKFSRPILDLINNKINQLDYNSYDSAYIADHTDGQTRNLIIYHKGNREFLQIYGHEEEPLEANVLFHYLTEIYKWIDLQRLDYELSFNEIEKIYPKPPPPPNKEVHD